MFDGTGRLAGCCTLEPHADQPIFIDSQAPPGSLRDAPPVEDGVLAIFAITLEPPPLPLRTRYLRLFSLIDWYSDDGLICSLHNDQSVTAPSNGHRFTEMVVDESDAHESYLVICNGPHAHGPGAITLVVQTTAANGVVPYSMSRSGRFPRTGSGYASSCPTPSRSPMASQWR